MSGGKTIIDALKPEMYRLFGKPITIYDFYLESPYVNPSHRYCAYDNDIIFAGNTYTALAIKRNSIKSEEGTIINDIDIGLDNVDFEFRSLVASGVFNKKKCKISLVFANQLDSETKRIILFFGNLDAPNGDDVWVNMKVVPFGMLDREYPHRIFQVGCNYVFGDSDCTKNLSDFAFTLTAGVGTTKNIIVIDDSLIDYLLCLRFSSGGTYVPQIGDAVTGRSSGAIAEIVSVNLYYGSWLDGDAVGVLVVKSQSGNFVSEIIDIGGNADVCNVSGDTNITTIKNDYFCPGYIEVLTGNCAGQIRPIQSSDNVSISLRISTTEALSEGDTFKVQKLCIKSLSACDLFGNRMNFGGFPSVPKEPVL